MVLQLAGRTESVQWCWGIGVKVVDGGRWGGGRIVCIVTDGLDWIGLPISWTRRIDSALFELWVSDALP